MPKKDFAFSDDWYTVEGAQTMLRENPSALRKEYTRMRDIAQKRLGRLKEDYSWTKTFKEHKQGFKKLFELTPQNMAKAFSELSKFVRAGSSTVTGQKRTQQRTMETLNTAIGEKGAVNKKNYKRVIELLNEARKQKVTYGSDKIVQLADATLSLNKKQFGAVLDNLEKLLQHSDTIKDSMQTYIAENDLRGYNQINMDDFINQLE